MRYNPAQGYCGHDSGVAHAHAARAFRFSMAPSRARRSRVGSHTYYVVQYPFQHACCIKDQFQIYQLDAHRICHRVTLQPASAPPSASVGFDFSKHVKPYHARGMPDCMMQHASDIIATSSTSQRCDVLVRFGTENTVGYMCRTAQPPPRSDGDMSATAWRR